MKKVKKPKLPPIQLDLENGEDVIMEILTKPDENMSPKTFLKLLKVEESWK